MPATLTTMSSPPSRSAAAATAARDRRLVADVAGQDVAVRVQVEADHRGALADQQLDRRAPDSPCSRAVTSARSPSNTSRPCASSALEAPPGATHGEKRYPRSGAVRRRMPSRLRPTCRPETASDSGVERLDVDLVGALHDELLARRDVGAHQQLEDLGGARRRRRR